MFRWLFGLNHSRCHQNPRETHNASNHGGAEDARPQKNLKNEWYAWWSPLAKEEGKTYWTKK